MPEALTARREDLYLGFFYRNWGGRPDAIPEDTQREYLRTYRLPGAMRAGFNLYRATSLDVVDNEAFRTAGSLEMPVLYQGGALGRGRGWPLSNPSAELPATCAAASYPIAAIGSRRTARTGRSPNCSTSSAKRTGDLDARRSGLSADSPATARRRVRKTPLVR